jgi:light-harvesting complex I chlorophyll a/b binding protein 5
MFCLILLCFSKFSLAGDFGFDPLGLGEDPESGMWRQSWSMLARFAMAGVAGILFTDVSYTKPVSGLKLVLK